MTLAITGASGQLGRRTAELLLDSANPSDVVLTTRTPADLADLAARGADVRFADFADPTSLATAFAGVDKLLLISIATVGDERLVLQQAAVNAARDAGVGHVIYTSIPEPTPGNPGLVVPSHAGTERALQESGMTWTLLRNNLYADGRVDVLRGAIATGSLPANSGDGRTAFVARDDCAAVAAAVLLGDGHENRSYDVTGPEALDATDLAAIAAKLAGSDVEVVDVDDDAYRIGLVDAGLPAPVADIVTTLGAATRGGYLRNVSTSVHDILGRPPATVSDVMNAALANQPPDTETDHHAST